MNGLRGIWLITLALVFLSSIGGAADILRWVDEKGVIHFTDSERNIPEKFRAKAKRIKASGPPPPAASSLTAASIPFQKRGELMMVQATLNEKTAANFIVDTGASYTTISQAVARQLDIDLEKDYPILHFQTANGVIQAPLVSLQSIEVGGLKLKDISVAVHDVFPDPTVTGLLGLNFLSQFRVDIDSKNSLLNLERK
jgi:clan AA aspartic protease (TIGR02281 family)